MRSLRTLSSQMKEMLAHAGGTEHPKSRLWVALVVVGSPYRMMAKDRVLYPRSSMLKAGGVEWRVLGCVDQDKTSYRPANRRNNTMNSDGHQRFRQIAGRCTEAEMIKVLVKFRFSTKSATIHLDSFVINGIYPFDAQPNTQQQ